MQPIAYDLDDALEYRGYYNSLALKKIKHLENLKGGILFLALSVLPMVFLWLAFDITLLLLCVVIPCALVMLPLVNSDWDKKHERRKQSSAFPKRFKPLFYIKTQTSAHQAALLIKSREQNRRGSIRKKSFDLSEEEAIMETALKWGEEVAAANQKFRAFAKTTQNQKRQDAKATREKNSQKKALGKKQKIREKNLRRNVQKGVKHLEKNAQARTERNENTIALRNSNPNRETRV